MINLSSRIVGGRSLSPVRHGSAPRRRVLSASCCRRAVMEALESRTLLSVSIINGAGSGYVGNGGGGPPDVTGAAGPSSYIESSNGNLAIHSSKANGTIAATVNPDTFFFVTGGLTQIIAGSQRVADVTMMYDNVMGDGRFMIGTIDISKSANVSQFVFAVSKSNNPLTFGTSDWNFYAITTTEGSGSSQVWTDYPGNPGFNADAVVLTFNTAKANSLTGNSEIVSINSNDLANGVSQGSLNFYRNDISGSNSFRPTAMQDSVTGDPMWLIRNPQDGTHVDVVKMTNILSNSASFSTTSLSLPAGLNFAASGISNPLNPDGSSFIDQADEDEPAQPGNSPASDIDDRILNASEINNTLVAAQKVAVGTASVVSATLQTDSGGNPIGGSGYTVGDTLTVSGGSGTSAVLTVATLGAGGSVATVTVTNPGSYTSLSGINGTVSGGTGSGAQFNFNYRGETDVQWYAIDVSGTPTFQLVGGVANVGRIGFGANTYAVDPSIAINASGEIGLGFMECDTVGGAVNPTTGGFLSTFVTARKPTDAAGTMQPVVLVPAGTGSANINGRIGDFSGMNVDPANGTFWHINEFGGGGPIDIANFTPEDRPVVTAPSDQIAVEGASKSFNLGSFSDPDGSPWTVDVNWGDATAHTIFSVVSAGSLGTKTHTFAEEGNFTVTVSVTDFTGLAASATFKVDVSDPAVIGSSVVFNAVEGADSGSQAVATFTDPGGAEVVGDYSAVIDWGDGTATSAGNISYVAGTFTVSGNHTYAEESAADHAGSNPYDITVSISHEAAPTTTVHSTGVVSDPAALVTGGFTFNATEGQLSPVQTVATFTDPGGPEPLSDYSALIDWGDGTSSAGAISYSAGVYTVQGSHTYATGLGLPDDFGNTFCDADPPSYHKPITVTVRHEAAPAAQGISDAKISLAPASAHLTSDGNLIIVGTRADDNLLVTPVGSTGAVNVSINNNDAGSFTLGPGGRIVVAAMAGNDDIQIAGGVRLNTVLYGGPGDDRIKGGGGRNIQVGCEGNDEIIAGNLGDLLIGGSDSDRLVGGSGNDILIAAVVINPITLAEDDKFSDLIAILNGGAVTVLDDNARDVLTGAAGVDTAYLNLIGPGTLDLLTDKGEIAVDV